MSNVCLIQCFFFFFVPIFSPFPLALGIPMCVPIPRYVEPRVDITHMTKAASPVDRVEEPALVIMLTSNRTDMIQRNRVPNHFAPVVPQSCQTKETETPSLPHEVLSPEECLGQYLVIQ